MRRAEEVLNVCDVMWEHPRWQTLPQCPVCARAAVVRFTATVVLGLGGLDTAQWEQLEELIEERRQMEHEARREIEALVNP